MLDRLSVVTGFHIHWVVLAIQHLLQAKALIGMNKLNMVIKRYFCWVKPKDFYPCHCDMNDIKLH